MAIAQASFHAVTHFCVVFGLLYGWKTQTWPIIRFLTVSHLLICFNLLVFDRIYDAMCLNKMSSSRQFRNILC